MGSSTPGVSCFLHLVLSCLALSAVSILETISLSQPQQPTDPVRSADQDRAEQSREHSVKGHGHTATVTGCWAQFTHRQLGFRGARLQSQFDEIRINRPLESISLPLPPTPRLTLFPHLWSQPPFFLLSVLLPARSCHFSQSPPASTPADALRCTCRQTELSLACGESRPPSARLPFCPSSPLACPPGAQARQAADTTRCESGSSVRAQQQIDWPNACNNIGSTDHFHPAHTTLPSRSSHTLPLLLLLLLLLLRCCLD